jgi:hypothetical protein
MYAYYEACFEAGPRACAIYDKSPQAIKARVDRILERLKVQPIAASVSSSPGSLDYGVVDFSLLKIALFDYLYMPYGLAPTVAAVLAALEQGDAGPLWQVLEAKADVIECTAANNTVLEQLGVEPQLAVECSDGTPVHDTLEQLEAWYQYNAHKSSFAGVSIARVQCS